MKENKFKFWDSKEKIMYIDTPSFAIGCNGEVSELIYDDTDIKDYVEWRGTYYSEHIIPIPYLGITDKNGVEIYADSIVKLPLVDSGEGDVAVFEFTAPNYILKGKKGYYEISIGKKSRPEAYEVIGSIYENPELLLDIDSICYGCCHYIGGENGCMPPDICIEGSLNEYETN